MKRIVLLLLLLAPFVLRAQDESSTFQTDFAGSIEFYGNRVVSLVDAIPAEKYSWSPAEGVRNVGEVVAHVSGANYFFAASMGMPAEGVDPMSINAEMSKEDAVATLKASVEHLVAASKAVPDEDLGKMMDFFGSQYSKRSIMLMAFSHVSEHLGQMIAYARSNDVTPPWSMEQEGGGE